MSKQTFSISWNFALYFPFLMRPHDARSSVSILRLSFAVFGLHSYPEQLYFMPSLIAFTLQIFNTASIHIQMAISLAWNELFQKFQRLKLIVFLLYPSGNKDQAWVDKCQYDSFFKF